MADLAPPRMARFPPPLSSPPVPEPAIKPELTSPPAHTPPPRSAPKSPPLHPHHPPALNMFALRQLPRVARLAPRAPTVARTLSSSVARRSDHQEPLLQGPGGKTGEVPTDLEQATGLERFELLMKLKGEEAFSMEPLEVTRLGTPTDPIEVFSLVSLNEGWSGLEWAGQEEDEGWAISLGCG